MKPYQLLGLIILFIIIFGGVGWLVFRTFDEKREFQAVEWRDIGFALVTNATFIPTSTAHLGAVWAYVTVVATVHHGNITIDDDLSDYPDWPVCSHTGVEPITPNSHQAIGIVKWKHCDYSLVFQ